MQRGIWPNNPIAPPVLDLCPDGRTVSLAPGLSPGDPPGQGRIEITVDGSGDGHSIALFPGEEVYIGYERGVSNNEAEFNAVILALEQLPRHSHARILTDSQAVVWALSNEGGQRDGGTVRRTFRIRDLIATRDLAVEIAWIPRRRNRADRLLRRYIASLCGAGGGEPLYVRLRRLESENRQLRARLSKMTRTLRNRPPSGPVLVPPPEIPDPAYG